MIKARRLSLDKPLALAPIIKEEASHCNQILMDFVELSKRD